MYNQTVVQFLQAEVDGGMKMFDVNQLIPYKKEVKIEYTGENVQLTPQRAQDIETFWLDVNKQQQFFRGDVFTIQSIGEGDDVINIKVSRTDYAHYLHTIRNGITDHEGCKIVYGAGLVETKDSKFVIGNMARHTAHPNRLQCVGGGLDQKDRRGPYFDIKESVLRELHEELGVGRQYIAHCAPVFLMKSRTYDDVVILYHIVLNIGAKELSNIYQSFTYQLVKKGQKPEFEQTIFIDRNREAVDRFLTENTHHTVDYLYPFLMKMANEEFRRGENKCRK